MLVIEETVHWYNSVFHTITIGVFHMKAVNVSVLYILLTMLFLAL